MEGKKRPKDMPAGELIREIETATADDFRNWAKQIHLPKEMIRHIALMTALAAVDGGKYTRLVSSYIDGISAAFYEEMKGITESEED